MKKALLLMVIGCAAFQAQAKNPMFWGADPSGVVARDGRVFVFPTYDLKDWSDQKFWECWSSSDLVNWTNHGKIFDTEMSGWGINNAWAPDITFKNGKYYFYYYFNNGKEHPGGVGVAIADKPEGPYKEALGKMLIRWHDPCIFNDDDGRSYLYAQNKVRELNPDMVSFKDQQDIRLEIGEVPDKYEATYVFKRNGVYYFTYAKKWNHLIYYTGDNPKGPFTYRGEIMKPYGANNHHSIIEHNGKWIIFYHEWAPKESETSRRRIRAEWLEFNDDGTIKLVEVTEEGLSRKID
ncbi:Xylosidase/arabinosidase [Pontiella desulfatans]|uniref:Xylosidase/arabinosidase n=1 Tax=Pontiella desulfatans TaxID=2750659 RepID=A0A6C2U0D5_PONDE|nr:family 43 glycosylhydrolase [Pontiella desulfatans]VGO13337.1 Xylosidase/arabinosidase [Pontiella desulfatans]